MKDYDAAINALVAFGVDVANAANKFNEAISKLQRPTLVGNESGRLTFADSFTGENEVNGDELMNTARKVRRDQA